MTNDSRSERPHDRPAIAIACESGGFRCAFVHGVLSALEEAGISAGVIAAASASVMPAAYAAVGRARELGAAYWLRGLEVRQAEGNGMSEMILAGLRSYSPQVRRALFTRPASRLIVATSRVMTEEAAEKTQGPLASRLGRELLLAMARHDRSWPDSHLEATMFDTASPDPARRLTDDNFDEVAYASTRMLHAWRVPATIDGEPHIDASYTCGSPVAELAALGFQTIISIASSPGTQFRDLFHTEAIEGPVLGASVDVIAPEYDSKELGVDFTNATSPGLDALYEYGRSIGKERARDYC